MWYVLFNIFPCILLWKFCEGYGSIGLVLKKKKKSKGNIITMWYRFIGLRIEGRVTNKGQQSSNSIGWHILTILKETSKVQISYPNCWINIQKIKSFKKGMILMGGEEKQKGMVLLFISNWTTSKNRLSLERP